MWVEDFQKSKPGSKADCMNYTDYESIISELVKNTSHLIDEAIYSA